MILTIKQAVLDEHNEDKRGILGFSDVESIITKGISNDLGIHSLATLCLYQLHFHDLAKYKASIHSIYKRLENQTKDS